MESWVYAVPFGIAFVLGVRASVRMTLRYWAVADELDWRERLVLLLLMNIAWVITIMAGYVGFLSVRTLLGYEPINELRPVTVVLSTLVLLLPAVIDFVVARVARVEWPK